MAGKSKKKKKSLIKLVHKETGHIYYSRKNPKLEGKLSLKKYNPKTRKHEVYLESK
jgi:ribosomal protein L33